ncbi:MAG: hypothetical protein INR73_13885 [Williamsia sp.]|nr:hypothetical protein [Williamsia sp.]
MATTDNSTLCTINNNSGKDILIALSINKNETAGSETIVAANGQLEILKTSNGGTVIKNNSSGTVKLDHHLNLDGESNYLKDYDLQICDNSWVYPVADLPVTQQTTNGSVGFGTQVVSTADQAAMNQAVKFYQTITANPSSQLFKNYEAAVKAARDAALAKANGNPESANAIADAVSDTMSSFFNSTIEYKDVTLAQVAAIDNYYKSFPAVWAQFKDSMTYYLYGGDGITSSFAGILLLKKSGPLDITKPNGGFICLFVPAVKPSDLTETTTDTSKAINLTYNNGLFVDDPKAGTPKIALRGSFVLRRLFTVDSTDESLTAIVAGKINNITYVGLDTAQGNTDSVQIRLASSENVQGIDDAEETVIKFWDRLTHPGSMKDWVISIVTLVGTIGLGLASVYGVYRLYKYIRSKPLPKQLVDDTLNQPVKAEKEIITTWQGTEHEAQMILDLPPDVAAEITHYGSIAQTLNGGLNIQRMYMKELLQYSSILPTEDMRGLQSLLTEIKASEITISGIFNLNTYLNPEKLPGQLEILKLEIPKFGEYQTRFDEIFKKVENNVSDSVKNEIIESSEHVTTLGEGIVKQMEKTREEKTELDPETKEEIRPELEYK